MKLFGFYFKLSWELFFLADFHCLSAANSGLFARTKRVKMQKRISNKQKSTI